MKHWWQLTDDEVERRNPPTETVTFDAEGNCWMLVPYYEDWQPVGSIPRPRTRLGWFTYHLIHGLAMRYPWWKVIGFALANTNPGVVILGAEDMEEWEATE